MNILMNHFSCQTNGNSLHKSYRSRGLLTVALFDFNLAIIMPPGMKKLPWSFSYVGGDPQPDDVSQGEYEYDPFAFDVACLGLTLLATFKVC